MKVEQLTIGRETACSEALEMLIAKRDAGVFGRPQNLYFGLEGTRGLNPVTSSRPYLMVGDALGGRQTEVLLPPKRNTTVQTHRINLRYLGENQIDAHGSLDQQFGAVPVAVVAKRRSADREERATALKVKGRCYPEPLLDRPDNGEIPPMPRGGTAEKVIFRGGRNGAYAMRIGMKMIPAGQEGVGVSLPEVFDTEFGESLISKRWLDVDVDGLGKTGAHRLQATPSTGKVAGPRLRRVELYVHVLALVLDARCAESIEGMLRERGAARLKVQFEPVRLAHVENTVGAQLVGDRVRAVHVQIIDIGTLVAQQVPRAGSVVKEQQRGRGGEYLRLRRLRHIERRRGRRAEGIVCRAVGEGPADMHGGIGPREGAQRQSRDADAFRETVHGSRA